MLMVLRCDCFLAPSKHLGLVSNPVYARRWAKKRKAYLEASVKPGEDTDAADPDFYEECGGAPQARYMEVERLARTALS